MSKAQELKPCPFCNGFDSKHQADCYFTLHKRLQAESEYLDFSLAPAVIQAWNRRVASSEPQAAQQENAERHLRIRNGPHSDRHGDVYAMTFQGDGDIPIHGDDLDRVVDAARASNGGKA